MAQNEIATPKFVSQLLDYAELHCEFATVEKYYDELLKIPKLSTRSQAALIGVLADLLRKEAQNGEGHT